MISTSQNATLMRSGTVPGTVAGSVAGSPNILPATVPTAQRGWGTVKDQPIAPPEASLPRGVNFYADFSGCGYWRMIWPEQILNAYQKVIVHGSTVMIGDKNFYKGAKVVRIQRQATPAQMQFVQFLKNIQDECGFKLVYEIDDVIFSEDIPDYNKFKPAFADPVIRETSQKIMGMCDEITVTCDYMKGYYQKKTGNENITVIPNFMPKFWMGHYYDEKKIKRKFDKHRKKPRILYPGSGAHFDVDNKAGQIDDFAHVLDAVHRTRDKYQWVFMGGFPIRFGNIIQAGQMEYIPWKALYDYPQAIDDADVNLIIAPLIDSPFNNSKSDLKYIESCAYGLPSVCQDIHTYKNAPYKFTTGDEMISQIETLLKSKDTYMKASRKARSVAEGRWLENPDNIGMYKELYTLPYMDKDRKLLNKVNNISI